MDTLGDRFWQIIEASRSDDPEEQAGKLHEALSALSPDEILAFEKDFRRARIAAYRWDLWGAAYVINGGASDDGFDYFLSWLVGQGRGVYEAALADPETLADHVEPGDFAEAEELAYVALEAYEEQAERDFPPADIHYPASPAGEPWEEDDLPSRFPRLFAKFAG